MAAHDIAVTVNADSIHVEPDTLVMTSNDEVRWATSNAREFSIEFESPAAFGQNTLTHAVARTHQRPRAKGRFKYTVISSENPSLRLDPVIIVGDPPTKPNP